MFDTYSQIINDGFYVKIRVSERKNVTSRVRWTVKLEE